MTSRDPLDACTFQVRAPGGKRLGTAVLVGRLEALTCSHVVKELERVDLFEAGGSEPVVGARVEQRGDPKGPDDLALLRLDKPLAGRTGLRFGDSERGDSFHAVGFPAWGKDQVNGTVQGPGALHGWLRIDTTSKRQIEPGFSGAAVWIPARNRAVGIVTHRDPDKVAYVVPTAQIRAFWPLLGRVSKPSMVCEPRLPNVGFTQLVKIQADGATIGQGLRLHATWVVTAEEVVGRGARLTVQDPAGSSFRLGGAKVLWPEEGEEGGLVLLETRKTGAFTVAEVPLPREVPPGAPWRALSYPETGTSPLSRLALCGRVGELREGRWRLEVDGGWEVGGEPDAWAGAAVYVDPEAGDRWCFLGLLGFREGTPGSGLEARPLAALEAWEGFAGGFAAAREAARWEPSLFRLGRSLAESRVFQAVREADPEGAWEAAADPNQLAKELCFETEPDTLTVALVRAHEEAIQSRAEDLAESLFEVLMDALPAALVQRWQVPIPDGSATEVRLGLSIRVLVELALAAAAAGPAEFQGAPDPRDPDFSRATHEVAHPGELGPDPDGDEAAAEVAHVALLRRALEPPGPTESERQVSSFIAELAAFRGFPDGKTLASPSETEASVRDEILRVINLRLARGTSSGRRLYLLAGKGDEALIAGLQRHLPELQIVTTEGADGELLEYEQILDALKTAFRNRFRRERPSP